MIISCQKHCNPACNAQAVDRSQKRRECAGPVNMCYFDMCAHPPAVPCLHALYICALRIYPGLLNCQAELSRCITRGRFKRH